MVVNSLYFVFKQTWVWGLALPSTTNLGKLLNHWKLQFPHAKKNYIYIYFPLIEMINKISGYLWESRCDLKGRQETSHSDYMLSSVDFNFRDGELQINF